MVLNSIYFHDKSLFLYLMHFLFLLSSPSHGRVCPTWRRISSTACSQWTRARGWQPARRSSTPGLLAWLLHLLWRTYSAASLRTCSRGRRRAARARSQHSQHAPAARASQVEHGVYERRSWGSSTAATSNSTTAEE